MFPKEIKDKQITKIHKNTWQNEMQTVEVIYAKTIFLKKLEKRKVFILKEKHAGLAIKSMSIDSEVLFLRRKRFKETLKSMLRSLISDSRHIF